MRAILKSTLQICVLPAIVTLGATLLVAASQTYDLMTGSTFDWPPLVLMFAIGAIITITAFGCLYWTARLEVKNATD